MTRVAILDDYQDVAREFGDWDSLDAEVVVFRAPLEDIGQLEPFDVIVAMRERTPFPRERLERLPNLRLLVTTGMGNAAIDAAPPASSASSSPAPTARRRTPPSSRGA